MIVTSDSNEALAPAVGCKLQLTPMLVVRLQLEAIVLALRTVDEAPLGAAWPLNCKV